MDDLLSDYLVFSVVTDDLTLFAAANGSKVFLAIDILAAWTDRYANDPERVDLLGSLGMTICATKSWFTSGFECSTRLNLGC